MADGLEFSPLSDDEREAAGQEVGRDGETGAAKPICPRADAEAPEAAATRLFGRPLDAIWRYRTAEAAIAFCVCRWNRPDGDKDVRPLSWFEGEGWRFAHWPAARPLYNLDRIAAEPAAPIAICEGEKAADAAARIFPEFIATTSSGGANAASKTDWTPLDGRRVLIWPDNDNPGWKYALEVGAILAELDCDVSIIDAAVFYTQPAHARACEAKGEFFDPMKKAAGYDAADALADWHDLAALRKAAASLAMPFDPGPAYLSFPPYTMDARGLAIEKEVGRGEAKRRETVRIAAPFEVLGACRDHKGGGWGNVLRWRDADGLQHTRNVLDADLHGEPAALCASLANEGLRIVPARHRDFVGYLSVVRPKRRLRVVMRTGWHEIGGRFVFQLVGGTIGPRGGEHVIPEGTAHGPYGACGSVEDWRDGAAKLASGHALPVLAISAALAGPLLHLAGVEGGGVHFFGRSSQGKTTLLQLAASVWGRGGTPGYVRTWRATANGLEGAAAGTTDTALILDELGQVDGRELAAALYSLANGAGKQRALRDGALREPRSWRVLTISSGELPVEAKLAEDRSKKTRGGQLVRMLDIPAARARGVFDHAGPDGDAAALAKTFKLAAVSAYGTAGPEFVRRLIAENVSGDDVRSMVADFIGAQVPPGADGQVDRAAQRLGVITAAGELATVLGLTGWREGEAREATAWALERWIEGRGGTEPAEVRQAIEAVRHFIEAHGEARFDNGDDPDARPVPNRAGWRKGAGKDRRWLILPEVWKSDVCAGLDAKFVARVLADSGMIERAPDGFQPVHRIAGTSKRVYVVTPRIFAGGDE
jgi:putative DNA primase/helicase